MDIKTRLSNSGFIELQTDQQETLVFTKEQAERIVDRFYNIDPNAPNYLALSKRQAEEAAIIALEMLIESLKENIEHGAFTDQNTAIREQIKGYKEVLKAIKNME